MSVVSDSDHRLQQEIWNFVGSQSRAALKHLLESFMEAERDAWIACRAYQRSEARRDYRNGYFARTLDTRQGPVRLRVPRVRCGGFRSRVFDRYRRRTRQVEEAIRNWVAAGLSTRAVERSLWVSFGDLVSATTVSRVVAEVDRQLQAFHHRELAAGYRIVWLDAKHGSVCRRRKQGKRGRKTKAVLLSAWGLRHDGREELIDFRACHGEESEENWTAFLTDLEARGLTPRDRLERPLELIVTDGDGGLEAALLTVYPHVPKQRCVFHKLKNIADHLAEREHREAMLADAARIYRGVKRPAEARARLRDWVDAWRKAEPDAVRNFCTDFDRTLLYLNLPPALWSRVRTTNPLERLHAEMERMTGRVCAWQHLKSWERRIFLLWRRLRETGYRPTKPNPNFTQNS